MIGTALAALNCLQIMSTCIVLKQPFKDFISALHVFSDPVDELSATGDTHRLLRVQGPAFVLLRISLKGQNEPWKQANVKVLELSMR